MEVFNGLEMGSVGLTADASATDQYQESPSTIDSGPAVLETPQPSAAGPPTGRRTRWVRPRADVAGTQDLQSDGEIAAASLQCDSMYLLL